MQISTRRWIAFGALLLSIGVLLNQWALADAETLIFEHDGVERDAIIYTPDNLPDGLVPAVIVLHGGNGDAQGTRRLTGFDDVADDNGFIVVYPNGIDNQWNDGREGIAEADDVGAISALIDRLIADYAVDPARIYATGISNGGFMSFRLGCELSDRIAAIAPVTATLSETMAERCEPTAPMAVLLMNGTDDPLVPYNGGYVSVLGAERGAIRSTDETMAFWVDQNGCEPTVAQVALPNLARFDGTRAYRSDYTDCAAPVTLIRIDGGGHTWPGGLQYLPRAVIGRVSRDIDGSEVIWDFFAGVTRAD